MLHSNLSYVESHEDPQKFIDDEFTRICGKPLSPNFRLTRYFCAVRIFIRPGEYTVGAGGTHKIIIPEEVRAEDRYSSCTGFVCALGPQAFKDRDGNQRISAYSLCDFLLFPRTDIIRVDFCGVPLGIMTDDRAIAVIKEPSDWVQGGVTYKS